MILKDSCQVGDRVNNLFTKDQDQLANPGNLNTIKEYFQNFERKLVPTIIQMHRYNKNIDIFRHTVASNVVPTNFLKNVDELICNPGEQQRKPQKKQAYHQHIAESTAIPRKEELPRTMGFTDTPDHTEKNSKMW